MGIGVTLFIAMCLSFVLGYAVAVFTGPTNAGVLHIDKSNDDTDYYILEVIEDLDTIEKKQSVTFNIDVRG